MIWSYSHPLNRFGFKIEEQNIANKKNNYRKLSHLFSPHAMRWWEISIRHRPEDPISMAHPAFQHQRPTMPFRIKFVIHLTQHHTHNSHHWLLLEFDRFELDQSPSSKSNFLPVFSRIIPYHFKTMTGTIKVSPHFESIIHRCFIIQHEQCVSLSYLWNSENISFFCICLCHFVRWNKERKLATKKKKRNFSFFSSSLFLFCIWLS